MNAKELADIRLAHHKECQAKDLTEVIRPLKSQTKGSTYGSDQVRVTGSPEFVSAVMGKIKELLAFENAETRIAISCAKVEATEINGERKEWPNASPNAVAVQVKVHERGDEAKIANKIMEAFANIEEL